MALTYYQILGVDSRAGFAELRRAYYRQAKRCHPDLFRNAPDKTREFQARFTEKYGSTSLVALQTVDRPIAG